MPNGEHPTTDEIFELVTGRLTELQAADLIHEIQNTIARGVVVQEHSNAAQVFRPMNSEEKLAVALEHIVSVFDVPRMLSRCKDILGCDEITWSSEFAEQQDVSSFVPLSDDRQNDIIAKLVDVIDELQLPMPEVA